MKISGRLRLISLALLAASVYIGVEIDFRHWTWIVFLVLVPTVIVGALLVTRDRKADSATEAVISGDTAGKPKPKPDAAEE